MRYALQYAAIMTTSKKLTAVSHALSWIANANAAKEVKLWDLSDDNPTCVHNLTDGDDGAVFCAAWSPDEPFYLACGGSAGKLRMWDTLGVEAVRRRFEGRVPELCARPTTDTSAVGFGAKTFRDDIHDDDDDDDDLEDDDDDDEGAMS